MEKSDTTTATSETAKTINIVTIGHMDHGKSTLIGRILYDSGAIKKDRIKDAEETSLKLGKDKIEFAFIMDAFQEEREGGMTIDIMHTPFESKKRSYMFIDCPGHHEFIKNMITGTSHADAALLIVSAKEGEGVQDQTKEHAWLVKTLGINQMVVVVNKMDTAGYKEDVYKNIVKDVRALLGSMGYDTDKIPFVPISAIEGENVYRKSERMPWYNGDILIDSLDKTISNVAPPIGSPLRIVVQDIYKSGGDYGAGKEKIIVGRVETGVVKVGEKLIFKPSGVLGKIKTIKIINLTSNAKAGDSIGFTLDENLDANDDSNGNSDSYIELINRGDVASHTDSPACVSKEFTVQIYIMQPMEIRVGSILDFRCGTAAVNCEVKKIVNKINPRLGSIEKEKPDAVSYGDAATLELVSDRSIPVEKQSVIPQLGRFVIQKDGLAVACGIVIDLKPIV